MEDIAVYCSWADAQLTEDARLPAELRSRVLRSTGSEYFQTLANAATTSPQYADILFPLYKPLYPELVARWTTFTSTPSISELVHSISCLARALPFATYLRRHVRDVLLSQSLFTRLREAEGTSSLPEDQDVQSLLLALFRLLSFDRDLFAETAAPTFLSSFLYHSSLPARYMAVQCLCLVMHFADGFADQMVETYIGKDPILGDWEGRRIDYRLLKIWEEYRWKELSKASTDVENRFRHAVPLSQVRTLRVSNLSPTTASLGGVLLPRASALESSNPSFVLTSTATRNLQQVGQCLLAEKPILLSGPPGSSKTAIVHEAARLLNKLSTMITLHLNEQTDAKSLLGVYTSSPDGDSFIWQAGVLTKAIQQGRWVLIEDIDRAPAEVMGVLRPILENGELFLPSRKETIRPKDGFRILATIKSAGRSPLTAGSRQSWLLNPRLWSIVEVASYDSSEIEALLRSRYPAADIFISTVLEVHKQISGLYTDDTRFKSLQTRSPSLRDLLKWTRRIVRRLPDSGQVSASKPLAQATKFHIFKDAVDCYASYINDDELHDVVAASVAREMGISPQQMRHCLDEGFGSISDSGTAIQIGRSTLSKVASRRRQAQKTPFALTRYAQRTLDRIAAGASCSEPCLLVGETGVGKTTLVQHIANLVSQKLTVVNLSQQSEVSDLLGGLKPVTTRSLILPLVETFHSLFEDTFSSRRNEKFQIAITKAVTKQNWPRLMILWNEAIQLAAGSLATISDSPRPDDPVRAAKRRKLATPKYDALRSRWEEFEESCKKIRSQVEHGDKNHTFAFVEGRLVRAVREGEWVLLDEINLASADTLDYIVSLLHNGDDERPSLLLAEAGSIETIIAHPNFRIFAAMNPATDAGKKDLPSGLRSRFTEIYVPSGDSSLEDLTKIIQSYLGGQLDNDKRASQDLARTYLDLKKLNQEHKLTDGAGDVPHFSIRSLVRCLLYVLQHSASHGLRRAMFEGFAMSFFTVLSRASETLALPCLEKHFLSNVKNRKSFLSQQPKMPFNGEEFIAFRHHLVKKGPMSPDFQPHYIRTPSVERNLLNLARAASMRRFPILLQGPTSAGKTSMVEYLAKLSGNRFVRINNHEHTDLQEYLGSYVSDADGKLQYREGVLVAALRQGHWIVLDELNLAPSDVLEALNRLLDDNRELLIPESQEIVRPHPNFMLFATQNPAGLYGGRKRLSRAFRNRFLELHFDDIPEDELEIILRERAQIAPSFCTQIVAVYKKLSLQRQSSRLFEQRHSFATLRDLFRWASRSVDDRQQLANHGFMLLAERVREPAERAVVKKTIEETMKVVIDESVLYGLPSIPHSVQQSNGVVWTLAMRRLFVLVSQALKHNEPVLLIGETGCGKTQICQVIAAAFDRPLDIYNAHTNTETGDLIGSQRPVRNRSELELRIRENWQQLLEPQRNGLSIEELDIDQLIQRFSAMDVSVFDPEAVARTRASIGAYQALFAWGDGSLVRAMKTGNHFLLDEISLADDSVLERLNSVLEPSRTILLAEKGSMDNLVVAHPGFQFLATMNPGGDYGKRELSAALRNRLTEIWVPPLSQEADILPIVQNKLASTEEQVARGMLRFATWFRQTFHNIASDVVSLRDLLAWAEFINRAASLGAEVAFIQGAFMIYVDSIGANPAGMTSTGAMDIHDSRRKCLEQLQSLVAIDVFRHYSETPKLEAADNGLAVGAFSLPGTRRGTDDQPDLVFDAPTTLQNTMRIVRALQMARPILLEGSPGVGKTAIVTALAQASGRQLTRINLSDQTDLMDLFGADAPSETEQMGKFSWQNGPLLEAMQNGGWVLLDEMNLASQSVLEGLNSCLDHRREVYIAELDKSFSCHPDFTLFAAQNPHHQGGGRKGLPASFVNRFTVVYADSFKQEDLICICQRKFPNVHADQLKVVVETATQIDQLVSQAPAFSQGGPWELNLRDVSRWLALCEAQPTLPASAHFRTIVTGRFRTPSQKDLSSKVCENVWQSPFLESFYTCISSSSLQVGTAFLARDGILQRAKGPNVTIAVSHLPPANSVITAINSNWPVILSGPSGSGKTTLVQSLAAMCGIELVEFSMNADVDTMDLVGGFEQYDIRREIVDFQHRVKDALRQKIALALRPQLFNGIYAQLLDLWQKFDSSETKLDDLARVLPTLSKLLPDLASSVEALSKLLSSPDNLRSRFVWNDGILVDAVEKGCWLVLDNANLCNPSVLDRLNSLLEPNGLLAVSEHHNAGNTRVIKPHPNFRIFLTMDPRYGELSRAMRNRSLEISMPVPSDDDLGPHQIQYPYTSSVARLRQLSEASHEGLVPEAIEAFVDNLSGREMTFFQGQELALPGSEALEKELSIRKNFDVTEAYRLSSLSGSMIRSDLPQLVALNEPLIQLQRSLVGIPWSSTKTEVFTRAWYVTRQLAEIEGGLKAAKDRARTVPARERTVLEKSAAAMAGQSKLPSDVPHVYAFAQTFITILSRALLEGLGDPELLGAIEHILALVGYMMLLSNAKSLDPARLHASVQVGTDIARHVPAKFSDLAVLFQDSLALVSAQNHALTTGRGLQLMWPLFQPRTARTASQLETQLALEELMVRFDWQTYASILDSDQAPTLLGPLQVAVADLELQSVDGFVLEGKFQRVMDYIHQIVGLQQRDGNQVELELMAMFTTSPRRALLPTSTETKVPHRLSQLASLDTSMLADQQSIGVDLVVQLYSVQEQPLGMLAHAKEELSLVTRELTSRTSAFDGWMNPLCENLAVVLSGMLHAHSELLTEQAKSCISPQGLIDVVRLADVPRDNAVLTSHGQDYFGEIYHSYIYPIVVSLASRDRNGPDELARCLITLSLAGLQLMVPDRIMDPAIYPTVAFQLHQRRLNEVESKIQGQIEFHQQTMGQETSMVIRILQNALLALGNVPPPPVVLRPGKSELGKLQEIFTRIARVLLKGRPVAEDTILDSEWVKQWSTDQGRLNLRTIIERLESSNRAYDDFVKPILWFLKCLSQGLDLVPIQLTEQGEIGSIAEVVRRTPMLGASPVSLQSWTAPVHENSRPSARFQWLEHVGLTKCLVQKDENGASKDLIAVLDQFYLEWKTRLIKDQSEAEVQSRYYAYRGDGAKEEEDDIHEMQEMFPAFDEQKSETDGFEAKYDARAVTVKLASLHQKLYTVQEPQDALQKIIMGALEESANCKQHTSGHLSSSFTDLLPAILLLMEKKVAGMDGTTQTGHLNIYSDSDVAESEKLYQLVRQVQVRFSTIAERWPEHAVPAETLSYCKEVLHLSISDPIAKLMTKTEKLYEIISQWQSVASREWSVTPLLDQLVTLIVSWRRLELLSWSGLLDEEKRRYEEDAQAWYFIAYESVLHNSARLLADGEDMHIHSKGLARTLESFFKTTTLGQYSARIRLLDTLNGTLGDIARQDKKMLPIHTCVTNIIEHYRRYESTIQDSLQSGRAGLETALKEQIKMASWKDTNITALRDSARRSHHKLFKIVKKYRSLLNQAVTVFKSTSPPAEVAEPTASFELSEVSLSSHTFEVAQKQCSENLPDWDKRPDRLTNTLGAAKSMRYLYMGVKSELAVHLELASFREDLQEAIKQLRSDTPSTLTEENTAMVRHLQERKRRLLADTLKAVIQMGVRKNLPTSELEKQSSSAIILASSPNLIMADPSSTISQANSTFHELLDIMSQVRAGRTGHSEDLTEGEVGRSLGLLEGLLSVVLNQRQTIASLAGSVSDLKAQLSLLHTCLSYVPGEISLSSIFHEDYQALSRHLAWLAEILVLSCRILSFQAQHARVDVQELLDSIRSYGSRVKELRCKLDGLPILPHGLVSREGETLKAHTKQMLSELRGSLEEWQVKEPRVEFVLRQIIPWAKELPMTPNGNQDGSGSLGLSKFDETLRTIADSIFVALQRLSPVQKEMPNSIDDQAWLTKTEKSAAQAVRSMQASFICDGLRSLFDQLHHLSPQDFTYACYLLRVASPIVEQYFFILEHFHTQQKAVHLESCRLALQLATSLNTLLTQGFCRPSEPADGQEQSGKLESGTGLGEGEGAEDISKDVGEDEDLTELAQSGEKEEQDGEMENAEDAVDMGNDDLEGEMGDYDEQKSDEDGDDRSEDEEGDDIDEETGAVDDLDPTAVDEKMWDDMKNESEEKELKNDKAKGEKSDDQTAADGERAEQEEMEGLEGEEQVDEENGDEGEGAERPEAENMDPHTDNQEALDLPEELQLAGEEEVKEDEISDDGMDELSDIGQPTEEVENAELEDDEKVDKPFEGEDESGEIEEQEEPENGTAQDDEIMEDQPAEQEEDEQADHATREDDAAKEQDEHAGGESGAANARQDADNQEQDTQGMNEADEEPNPRQSQPGKASEDQDQGDNGKGAAEVGAGRMDTLEHQQNEALKKLADVLDHWHNRREILPASEEQPQGDQDQDVDMADVDFEHVQEEDEGNAQALGAAAGDQARNLDQSKVIEDDNMPVDEDTNILDTLEPEMQENLAERFNRLQAQAKAGDAKENGTFIPSNQLQNNQYASEKQDMDAASDDDLSPDIGHLDLGQQSAPPSPPTSMSDAAQLWNQCSATTHQFSLILTEQLRLILSPTTATKLRGDYRTGKRLNIKRIIPYIASNYKRDKIWMRRSVPSKRNYQIMIAVDDSKSMSESGADLLAFETLAMLTKALSMLEVGEICVVGFGDEEHIRVAHPFGTPFSPAESGVNVFRSFGFNQRGTNVKNLVRESIQLFGDARLKGHSSSEDLWQLQLIVSDGHCSNHEGIARLVRQAQAEKIIIVFVIVDAGQDSILDLQEAVYEPDPLAVNGAGAGEMRLRTKRYLEDFPFPYYLVVRDVRDLPGVLATALKGWFGSVVDVQ
ncbi:AAA ATPase midasin [Exophiala xenobiotica]|nr:AAA ATPase midasin [Exophiala xenobiotica]KAK5402720.1 AAA ATPase midasin [Exophiala xenobiotica]KAK5405545.1 AAA ATPase midasin [Exophiala xenobiotica]KAK5466353.1 AAA ATPase midasin [Exophiala xenobiotica]KAK5484919.1 AAA ATPase midasin [Exophiala xenobiotica]